MYYLHWKLLIYISSVIIILITRFSSWDGLMVGLLLRLIGWIVCVQTVWNWIESIFSWVLTHWGRVTHICVHKLTITVSDNGLSPGRRQAIVWTNIVDGTLRDKLQLNFRRNSNIFIQENAFENVVCEMASILSRPQCVLNRFNCKTI